MGDLMETIYLSEVFHLKELHSGSSFDLSVLRQAVHLRQSHTVTLNSFLPKKAFFRAEIVTLGDISETYTGKCVLFKE